MDITRRLSLPACCLAVLVTFSSAFSSKAATVPLKARGEHLLLVVWDGMRPDFVRAETTPVLHALAQRGTFFANNRSIYITSTEVNGAAIATGCYPARTDIVANVEYRPAINLVRPISTEHPVSCRLGDIFSEGRYVGGPTLAELVQRAGHATAIAGTKPVALLHDRAFERRTTPSSATIFAGKANHRDALTPLTDLLGKFPPYPTGASLEPNTAQNSWTTRALIEGLWRDAVPRFSTLWLGDPDYSQHLTQPGSPTALAAIRDSDRHLGLVLDALQSRGVLEKTNIFLVSDHGFSTTDRSIPLPRLLKQAGFTTTSAYVGTPRPGEILHVPLGGSTQFYVPGRDPKLVQKLVTFLQSTDFTGAIFTRDGLPGTFPLSAARIETEHSPDVLFSFRWSSGKNASGVAGLVASEALQPGYGTHASLSPFDIRNTLIAAGPDIRAGFRNALPTANVDLAPTILHLLGLPGADAMDGRILHEALAASDFDAPKPETKTLEATTGTWRQYLKITTFGQHTYLDEGNASNTP